MREQYESPKAEVIEYEIEENILDISTNTENDIINAKALAESEEETITVRSGFFDKLIAFFKGLFKSLPVYVDNNKQ